jgi:hypothetical protein
MKTRTIVWTLWAMAVFYGVVNCQAVDEGERRPGRKRNRGSGSGSVGGGGGPGVSAFRPDQSGGDGRNLPLPVDPLFTDQREIRLSFMKVTLINLLHSLETI